VLDEEGGTPVATALVRLVDEEGAERAITAADSAGRYLVSAGGPGVFRVVAERLGYVPFESPLLEARDPEGVYPLDLLMRRAPIPIRGLEVSAGQAEREIRLVTGISPRSMRVAPIRGAELRAHAELGRDVTGLVRWTNTAGVIVEATTDGPCFQVRSRGCLPVYLDGFRMSPGLVSLIPLDMLDTVVILYPNETIAYGGGAVLLYTEAWLR